MKSKWLQQKSSQELLIFFNGWGMDENPFINLVTDRYDLLMFYDYHNLDCDIQWHALWKKYDKVSLVGWSMGVWAAQKVFYGMARGFAKTLAINGTLCPIHDKYGIPEEIFDATLGNFGEVARMKFYRRMCREKSNLKTFLKVQPKRSLENQKDELSILQEIVDCCSPEETIFKNILISDNDWVMPSANQLQFWQSANIDSLLHIEGFHYLFNLYQSWEQLMDAPENETSVV